MSSDFTTQSTNFLSAQSGAVDPRTGMYGYNISVAHLSGNSGLGPELPVLLRYSPLQRENNGFGIGVTLPVTSYDKSTRTLQLSTGESYKVIESGNILHVIHAKPINFKAEVREDGYYISYKNGITEILTAPDKAGIKVTEVILSPAGRKLLLSWELFGGINRLISVHDESTELLTVSYSSTGGLITFEVWPGTSEAHTLELMLQNEYLSSVLNQSLSLTWELEYTDDVLTKVTAPTGLIDRVSYGQQGHQFPTGGPSGTLPYVIGYWQNDATGTQLHNIRYHYTDHNFLGFGSSNSGSWDKDTDFLYGVLGDYEYGSTETYLDENDAELSKTTRTYNNYHLQTKETVQRVGSTCTSVTETEYYAIRGENFDDQPPQFQMPKRKILSLIDTSRPEAKQSRKEVTLTEYDENGNPVRQEAPDGTVTEYTFYSADGDGNNCPPSPNGFVRFMHKMTVIPRSSDYEDVLARVTEYTYTFLGSSDHVVQHSQKQYVGTTLLSEQVTDYNATNGNSEYGRIIGITRTLSHKEQIFTNVHKITSTVRNSLLTQSTTLTGHDGLTTVTSRTLSALSGLLFSETNAWGVTNKYTYDPVGRPLTQVIAFGTQYENRRTWHYALEDTGPITVETDALGNQTRMLFDAMGREREQQTIDSNSTKKWLDVVTCQYNLMGDYASGREYDWQTSQPGSESYSIGAEAIYDGWGQSAGMRHSNGIYSLKDTDPVDLIINEYSQGGNDKAVLTSGKKTTFLDEKSQLPVKEVLYDTNNVEQGIVRIKYDGLNQLRETQDERGNVTHFTRDDFGREVRRLLPDGTIVEREYAPYLSGNQVSLIKVTGQMADGVSRCITMGIREFDSLGRITESLVGGRKTTYHYQDACPLPDVVTLPSGIKTQYTYIPELNHAIKSLTTQGITQSFNYDPLTGDLLQASEGDNVNNLAWSADGQLKAEEFVRQGDTCQTGYTRTLSGEVTVYTDITGHQARYQRDTFGKVVGITDGPISITLGYDALSRLQIQTATDSTSASSLSTALTRDDFGRELTRTLTDSTGAKLIVAQTWLKNGLLDTRVISQQGSTVRTEQYEYDMRNRLVSYRVSGDSLPQDAFGHSMSAQTYSYDALNNLTKVVTTLKDSSTDTALYQYDNSDDPTQLSAVTHTHAMYPENISLEYDAEGRMTKDDAGRQLTYDAIGRLSSVQGEGNSGGHYSYDAQDQLVSQTVNEGDTRRLYYRGNELVNEALVQQKQAVRLIKHGHTCLGIHNGDMLTLTGVDQHDSLLWSRGSHEKEGVLHSWSPYGTGEPQKMLPGFNGERPDPVSGTYHLGNGYRAYNPALMRFNCPDSLSPFGASGINPYAYCAGDPVNFSDPSGHISWSGWLGIGLGIVGIALSVVTLGSSLVASSMAVGASASIATAAASTSALKLMGIGLGLVADVTGIASGATEETNPKASSILGWVSLGAGVAGIAAGLAPLAARGVSKTGRFVGDWQYKLQHAGGVPKLGTQSDTVTMPILKNTKAKLYDVEENLKGWAIRENKAKITRVTKASDLAEVRDSSKVHKFVFSEDGVLSIGSISKKIDPKNLSHPTLVGGPKGKGAISAGYMYHSGDSFSIVNHSGHYQPSFEDLTPTADFLSDSFNLNVRRVRSGSLRHLWLHKFN
ncbi:hypothetical protein BHU62_11920 [Serratia marcescens]|uniref:Type IV secretion protein Rhs n=1 Tax=Serratia marcescens TaxID=615 RepID=A0A1Q4P095_SERMA|nr:RHS repeat-associated core domain-containing protein [Serratia marcescens]OKB66575.1 hypothetical protein BHU62_11920 [Serratia marcescens]